MGRLISASCRAVVLLAACLSFPACSVAEDEIRLNGSTVHFASIEEGRAALSTDDVWVESTSDFQRAATLGVEPPVSTAQLRAFSADAVRAWPDDQVARWRRALQAIAPRFAFLHVPLPAKLQLINTDGSDAAGYPYTRANAVALPSALLPADDLRFPDEVQLAHELFHIVSRYDPALATKLYQTIGFESVPALQWPVAWLPLRIANPDAPFDRHAMRVTIDGRSALVMPLLVTRRLHLKPGETFFDTMDVRLLEVTVDEARTVAVMADGRPIWHAPDSVPDYLAKLGGNTRDFSHPEEAMADNFSFLVAQRPVPNQALLMRIEAVLLERR